MAALTSCTRCLAPIPAGESRAEVRVDPGRPAVLCRDCHRAWRRWLAAGPPALAGVTIFPDRSIAT